MENKTETTISSRGHIGSCQKSGKTHGHSKDIPDEGLDWMPLQRSLRSLALKKRTFRVEGLGFRMGCPKCVRISAYQKHRQKSESNTSKSDVEQFHSLNAFLGIPC